MPLFSNLFFLSQLFSICCNEAVNRPIFAKVLHLSMEYTIRVHYTKSESTSVPKRGILTNGWWSSITNPFLSYSISTGDVYSFTFFCVPSNKLIVFFEYK